jgi:aminopeptidase-like protein
MASAETEALGREMYGLVRELYPLCRSITGDGVRETLRILSRYAPLELHEVPSGTPVLDWIVPNEWNIRDAWIKDARGEKVVDFEKSNLHVVSYSVPVRGRFSLAQLRPHLHTLPDRPGLVPYRTSYYQESWGFCMSQRQFESLRDEEYEVLIDSALEPGSLTYGELLLPGELEDEILLSSHVCHPSLCDDNLSALAVSIMLAQKLARAPRRHAVRFLYAPGTIGAITWLARNRERAARVKHGLTLVCLGDHAPFTYKRTLRGDAPIDAAASHVLRHAGAGSRVVDFFPYGYDERQFASPAFRLPVGSLMRSVHGRFPEYHTSADDLDFVSPERLAEAFGVCASILDILQSDRVYRSLCPAGEPQLGRRGLYRALGGSDLPDLELAMLWVLCLSDGTHSLLQIAERAGLPFPSIRRAAELLERHGLLAGTAEPA